jgi:hypothetical protein
MTDLLQLAINVRNPTVNLNALCSSWANIGCCSSELIFTFLNADGSVQNASKQCVSCIHLCSVNFALRPAPQNKNLMELGPGDSNSSLSVPIQNLTHVHIIFFFSQRPTLSPPKILTFPPESSCIYVWNRLPSVDAVKYPVPWNSSSSMTLLRDTYETAGALCTINVLRGVTAMRVRRVYFSGSFKLHDVHLLL